MSRRRVYPRSCRPTPRGFPTSAAPSGAAITPWSRARAGCDRRGVQKSACTAAPPRAGRAAPEQRPRARIDDAATQVHGVVEYQARGRGHAAVQSGSRPQVRGPGEPDGLPQLFPGAGLRVRGQGRCQALAPLAPRLRGQMAWRRVRDGGEHPRALRGSPHGSSPRGGARRLHGGGIARRLAAQQAPGFGLGIGPLRRRRLRGAARAGGARCACGIPALRVLARPADGCLPRAAAAEQSHGSKPSPAGRPWPRRARRGRGHAAAARATAEHGEGSGEVPGACGKASELRLDAARDLPLRTRGQPRNDCRSATCSATRVADERAEQNRFSCSRGVARPGKRRPGGGQQVADEARPPL